MVSFLCLLFKNVNPNLGTVDIELGLIPAGASQIELQGGYGGKINSKNWWKINTKINGKIV